MKKILLSQGKFALVDDWNFIWLKKYHWTLSGSKTRRNAIRYLSRTGNSGLQRTVYMHREIMGLKYGDKRVVDHINHNTLDNRECNLRVCSHSCNMKNRKPQKGKSKYKGVNLVKGKQNKWKVQIGHNGKIIYGGCFDTEIEAAYKYNKLALKYHGKFANLNIVGD